MNPAIQKELDYITATIKVNTTPESIYLFGSYANGVPNGGSDIYVVSDSETDTIELNVKYVLTCSEKRPCL